jgi:hypothetical protein
MVAAPAEVVMAKMERNGPCSCGSGNKAKRCCFGPDQRIHVRILPVQIYVAALSDLFGATEEELEELFDQLPKLPRRYPSLRVRLPSISTPEMNRVFKAFREFNGKDFTIALADLVTALDHTEHRLQLGRAVISLRDDSHISRQLAAVAIFDLDRVHSDLFKDSVLISTATRDAKTKPTVDIATHHGINT